MKLHELIVLQELLEREQGVVTQEVQELREKVTKLEDEFYADDNGERNSLFSDSLELYKRELSRRTQRRATITSLLNLVNNSEFTLE